MEPCKWNMTRAGLDKFFRLSNGQWLKIIFAYKTKINMWFVDIVVSNSKRQCNDCTRKTEHSPKILYGHRTGNKLGIEALMICLHSLLEFETNVKETTIRVTPASDSLGKVYRRLLRYGYSSKVIRNSNGKDKETFYKEIK